MALIDQQNATIEPFRTWLESAVEASTRFGEPVRVDREDGATLATRWPAGRDLFYEVALRPRLPQVRVGVLTDDRFKSEDFEQLIEDSGDTMQEFVELGFETAGLEWTEPPVEHYREQQRYFYFATPLDLQSLDQLADDQVREKVRLMLEGYYLAFTGMAHA